MHVRVLILLVAALALWPAAASAALPADVSVLGCSQWEPDAGGSVTYEARMRSLPGTARMALRFRLLEKVGNSRYRRVAAKEVWRKSRAGATAFVWEHSVRGLRQGAVYRAVVHYRWLDADGNRIHAARRRSAPCRQSGGLPNLRVAWIDVRSGDVKETAVYRVRIVNRGDSSARRVGVLLRVDGEVVDELEVIEMLEPGEGRTVSFNGPVCRDRLRVIVDPKDLIAETRERDNTRAASCL